MSDKSCAFCRKNPREGNHPYCNWMCARDAGRAGWKDGHRPVAARPVMDRPAAVRSVAARPVMDRPAAVHSVAARPVMDRPAYQGPPSEEMQHPPSEEMQHRFLDSAKNGNWDEVYALLRQNQWLINVTPRYRWSALHQAAHQGDEEMVVYLLGKGADKTIINKHRKIPIEVAQNDKIRRLLTNEEDKHHFLDYAKSGDWDKVQYLLKQNRTLINETPSGRWSALHQAAGKGNEKMVKYLLDNGADRYITNNRGKIPIEVAKNDKIRQLLEPPPIYKQQPQPQPEGGGLSRKKRLKKIKVAGKRRTKTRRKKRRIKRKTKRKSRRK